MGRNMYRMGIASHTIALPHGLSADSYGPSCVIGEEYAAGRMLTGEVKKILIGILTEMTKAHQQARAAVTDEDVRRFMAVRPIDNVGSLGAAAPPTSSAVKWS